VKYLALEIESPTTTGAEFAPHLRAEAARAWELYKAGAIQALYFRPDRHTAVLVLECADAEAAYEILNSLPLVQAGLIRFDLIPLAPYTGFERLFGEAND
jgi:hypothetical protein